MPGSCRAVRRGRAGSPGAAFGAMGFAISSVFAERQLGRWAEHRPLCSSNAGALQTAACCSGLGS